MKKTFILVTTVLASFLGFSNNVNAQTDELVRVFRWYNPEDNEYVTVAEDEYQDGQLLNWKWTMKTQIFVAYRNPGPNRVAVYAWHNPVTKDHASLAEDEFTDDQMLKMGYTSKHLQFYALTRRGPNTVAVYRWKVTKHRDWVTIADDTDTDVYLKKGFRNKTFQYFGIVRNTDAYIYNQLDK
ncbi:MAG: hypothetical protein JNL72_10090 [Flavipsychrobacter sp.]|nr:hypothetical protein [Flavipsychrobacter sp.]